MKDKLLAYHREKHQEAKRIIEEWKTVTKIQPSFQLKEEQIKRWRPVVKKHSAFIKFLESL